jgi:alkaline phosphatase D
MSDPNRILFGSCNSQHHDQPLWPNIASRQATAFVWAGDAIYADDVNMSQWRNKSGSVVVPATPHVLKDLYHNLTVDKGYSQAVLDSNMTVLGIIDDHDYGQNNGDQTYAYRTESAVLYLDFLKTKNEATNLDRMAQRAAAGKGVYGVKVFDFARPQQQQLLSDEEAGLEPDTQVLDVVSTSTSLSNQMVAIFLLDVRSNKTPWKTGEDRSFKPDYSGDFLGEEQWNWFETALKKSTASVNIIVTGLQVHADRFFDGALVEGWDRFPSSQHRLYQAVLSANVQAPILVSGDVHMAELLRKNCRRRRDSTSRTLLEVTTSGMTHSWGTNLCARPHTSVHCRTPYFQYSLSVGMHFAHWIGAWSDLVQIDESKAEEGAKAGTQYSLDRNFGEFEFDWEKRQVRIRILGLETTPLLSTVWDMDYLSGPAAGIHNNFVTDADYLYKKLAPHGIQENDWICVNHGGHPSLAYKMLGVVAPISCVLMMMLIPFILPAIISCVLMKPRRGR